MYLFVRVTAAIFIILGIVLMLLGIGLAVLGAGSMINPAMIPSPGVMGFNFPMMLMGGLVTGAILFLQGLLIGALGQLMVVIADIGQNTAETNRLLAGMAARPPITHIVDERPPET